jgi:hypothetical protein
MISQFSQRILNVLDASERPLSTKEIAERLPDSKRGASVKFVEPYLRALNGDIVVRDNEGKWRISPLHEGKFSSSKSSDPASTDSRSAKEEEERKITPDEELTPLCRHIVRILKEAEEPLYAREIASTVLRGSSQDRTRVNRKLYGKLSALVNKDDSNRWYLIEEKKASGLITEEDYSEREDFSERDDSEEKDCESSTEDLGQELLQVLREAQRPVTTKALLKWINSGAREIDRETLERALRQHDDVAKTEAGHEKWYLESRKTSDSETDEVNEGEKDQADGLLEEHQGPHSTDRDKSSDDQPKKSWRKEASKQAVALAAVEDASAISAHLEIAKQVAFLLNLSSEPRPVEQIARVLNHCGYEASQEAIKKCLETTLKQFVVETEDGFRLRKEDDQPSSTTDTQDQKDDRDIEETDESDDSSSNGEGQTHTESTGEPVDTATRASVAGRHYTYTFDAERHSTPTLFSTQIRGGTITIKLNSSHSAYGRLRRLLDSEDGEMLRRLLVAWTEVEGDLSGRRKEIAEEFRSDWGRALRRLSAEEGQE